MGGQGKDTGLPRYRVKVVQGEPYHVEDRVLIPEVRMTSFGRARATIGSHRLGGWGVGTVQVKPLAVIDRTTGGEERVAIVDATVKTLWLLFGAALAMVLVFTCIRSLLCQWRGTIIEH